MKIFSKVLTLLLSVTLTVAPVVAHAQALKQFSYRVPLTSDAKLVPAVADLMFNPTSLQLNGTAGRLSEATVTLKNRGTAPSKVQQLILDNAAPGLQVVDGCAGANLAPSAECTFKVRFRASPAGTTYGSQVLTKASDGSARLEITTHNSPDTASAHLGSLLPSPATLHANGATTSTLTATVLDAYGNTIGAVPVTWSTSEGTLSQAETVSDESGKAQVSLTSSKIVGSHYVSAKTKTMVSPLVAMVEFVTDSASGAVAALMPSAASAVIGQPITLQATVKDSAGHPLPGVNVVFNSTIGGLSSNVVTSNSSGIAVTTVTSSAAGVATLTASTEANPAVRATGSVTFLAPKIGSVVASPASIAATGTSTTTLTASVTDTSGAPVAAGFGVNWSTSAGTLSGATSITNSAGIATAVLTSSTVASTATVSAKTTLGGTAAQATTVTFTSSGSGSGNPAPISLAVVSTISPSANSALIGYTLTLYATVKDTLGNLKANVPVNFGSTLGTVKTSAVSNSAGIAMSTVTSTTAGTASVRAYTSENPSVQPSTSVTFLEPQISALTTTANTIIASGSSTATLTATVTNTAGSSVGGGVVVNWKTTAGTLSNTYSITDAAGKASIQLISSTALTTATVTATAALGSKPGKASNVQFVVDYESARVLRVESAVVTERVGMGINVFVAAYDAYGHRLTGATVTFKTSLGTMTAASVLTDANGVAMAAVNSFTPGSPVVTVSTTKTPSVTLTHRVTFTAQ